MNDELSAIQAEIDALWARRAMAIKALRGGFNGKALSRKSTVSIHEIGHAAAERARIARREIRLATVYFPRRRTN